MKTFKSFISKKKRPGAGFEGTNEIRKDHISKTPYQQDPIRNAKPTPHLEESQRFTKVSFTPQRKKTNE